MAPEVSVIIPTYNRGLMLERCIESLLNQDFDKASYEIIIVNDGSTDNTERIVRGLCLDAWPKLVYIQQAHSGASSACNNGIKNAASGLLAFTEDDCILEEDWLSEVVVFGRRYPDADAWGCPVINNYFDKSRRYNLKFDSLQFSKKLKASEARKINIAGFRGILTGNCAIRKSVFIALGGFDTGFKYCEDAEFTIRMLKYGYRVYLNSKMIVRHYITSRIRVNLKKSFNFGIWNNLALRKHFDKKLVFSLYGLSSVEFVCGFPFMLFLHIGRKEIVLLFILMMCVLSKYMCLAVFSMGFLYYLIIFRSIRMAVFHVMLHLLNYLNEGLGFLAGYMRMVKR